MNRLDFLSGIRRSYRRAMAFGFAATLTVATTAQGDGGAGVATLIGGDLSASVGPNGLVEIGTGRERLRFVDAHPLVVRVTDLSGPRVRHRDHVGVALQGAAVAVVATSDSAATVSWTDCRIAGIDGSFDVACDYEVVAAPHGPAVAVRTRLVASRLAVGIAAIGYRQFLAGPELPERLWGGFTGALEVRFDDLADGTLDAQQDFLRSGGLMHLGASGGEEYLTTRTSETLLIAATAHPGRAHGLLVTRDGRHDPDNAAREVGLFGAHDITGDGHDEFGVGALAFVSNDDAAGNDGVDGPIGSGLVFGIYEQTAAQDPYWDVVRAYRARWIEPLLAGIDKHAERPDWMAESMYMVLNVEGPSGVRVDAVVRFLIDYLDFHDEVTDVALHLWGAVDQERAEPLPGLDSLIGRLEDVEASTGVRIRPSLYYLPTAYEADASGGTRLDQVCRDPFGAPIRHPVAERPGKYSFAVDTAGAAHRAFYANWMESLFPSYGIDGVYFDDAYRNRNFHLFHYDGAATLRGRRTESVAACYDLMQDTNEHFARWSRQGYLITELGVVGRSVPGNLVQGVPGVLEAPGGLFTSPQRGVRLRNWVNDVAGHHWLSGYAGNIAHRWLLMPNPSDLLFSATDVVHGMLPVQAPLAFGGGYYDFFQLSGAVSLDGVPEAAAPIRLQSVMANRSMAFLRRHRDVLTGWQREGLPGTHDIADHDIVFQDQQGQPAYTIRVPEIPFGTFAKDGAVAVALANPHTFGRRVELRLSADAAGVLGAGPWRVSIRSEQADAAREMLEVSGADSGVLKLVVDLPPLDFAMLVVEPRTGGTESDVGASGCAECSVAVSASGIAVTGAPAGAPGVLLVGRSAVASVAGIPCPLGVDPRGAIVAPFACDAAGAATFAGDPTGIAGLFVQAVVVGPGADALVVSGARSVALR